jgi:hypothetical protein
MTQSPPPKPATANPPSAPDVTMQTLATGHGHSALDRLPFDPAWIAIGVAGAVLIGASLSVMRGNAPQETQAPAARQETVATPAPVAVAPAPLATPAPPPAAPAPDIAALRARIDAAEAQARQAAERMAAMQRTLAQSEAEAQAVAARITPLADRLQAAEAGTARLVLLETLRSRLDSGQTLGPVLSRLPGTPPPALARFADAPPPTEPGLRLSFEDAVRTARASVAETQPRGIGSLFTIRRGEEVIWGDANEATLERARRALTAGDLPGAVSHLGNLPETHRAPMADWIAQAQALVAARSALRDLAGS